MADSDPPLTPFSPVLSDYEDEEEKKHPNEEVVCAISSDPITEEEKSPGLPCYRCSGATLSLATWSRLFLDFRPPKDDAKEEIATFPCPFCRAPLEKITKKHATECINRTPVTAVIFQLREFMRILPSSLSHQLLGALEKDYASEGGVRRSAETLTRSLAVPPLHTNDANISRWCHNNAAELCDSWGKRLTHRVMFFRQKPTGENEDTRPQYDIFRGWLANRMRGVGTDPERTEIELRGLVARLGAAGIHGVEATASAFIENPRLVLAPQIQEENAKYQPVTPYVLRDMILEDIYRAVEGVCHGITERFHGVIIAELREAAARRVNEARKAAGLPPFVLVPLDDLFPSRRQRD